MKKIIFLALSAILISSACFAQDKDAKTKQKKSAKDVLNELPDMLIAQPDAAPDTNANKLIDGNMSVVVNPLWREKGTLTFVEFKMTKTDVDPLKKTFPLSDKKIVQALSITMSGSKKPVDAKKQDVLNTIKNHISAYYKEQGASISAQELTDKANAALLSSEELTTNEGKKGTVYFFNDIQTQQSNFVALFLLAGANASSSYFVQFVYTHFTYETNLPEDMNELRVFVYPDDQQTYIDFTKGILKTLRIQ